MKRQADNEDLANFWRKHQADFLALVSPPMALFQVFDVLPDVYFFVKNASGQTLFCSRNLPSHHGFRSVEEMLGKTDQELTPGPMADAILADDQAISETGQPLLKKMELWVDLLGLPTWHLCSKFPLKDRHGKVIGIMGVLRSVEWGNPDLPIDRTLEPAVQLLENNLKEFPGLECLSDHCFKSARQFQRLFKQMFGMGPREYWMKLRIREACHLLRLGTQEISDVAIELGFCDQSTFTVHFRRNVGVTPAHYAKQHHASDKHAHRTGRSKGSGFFDSHT